MKRRAVLLGLAPFAAGAHAQSGVWPEWQGRYEGSLRFYRAIPLEDIYPPPNNNPHAEEQEDLRPIKIAFSIDVDGGLPSVWLRIDGGPMQTADTGETLRFSRLIAGVASMIGASSSIAPRTATLAVRPDSLGTEALFTFADGSFWRRHFNARFTAAGAELIVWVFDAAGTRARTWRGAAIRQASNYVGRGPT